MPSIFTEGRRAYYFTLYMTDIVKYNWSVLMLQVLRCFINEKTDVNRTCRYKAIW